MAFEDSHSRLFEPVKLLNILILPLASFQIKIIPSASPFVFFTQPYLSWAAWAEFHSFFKFMFWHNPHEVCLHQGQKHREEVSNLFFPVIAALAVQWHSGQSILESFTRKQPGWIPPWWPIKAASRYRSNSSKGTGFESGSLKIKDLSVWQANEKNWWWNV